jgi:hypothetical protein
MAKSVNLQLAGKLVSLTVIGQFELSTQNPELNPCSLHVCYTLSDLSLKWSKKDGFCLTHKPVLLSDDAKINNGRW